MTSTFKLHAQSRHIARQAALVGLACVAIGLTGCPIAEPPNSTALSEVELVTVGDGVSVETPLGAGAPILADSTWAIYKTSDDSLLFRIVFGPAGKVERLYDSIVFAKEWLGSEITPDTEAHPTDFPGGSYISGAYTAEQDGRVGVLGVLHGLMFGAHLGTATLNLSGSIEDDRIDGTMIRTVAVFAETPFPAPGNAEFEAYALREP